MYLYQTNGQNGINVLQLTEKPEEIKNFKRNELATINKEQKYATHCTKSEGMHFSSNTTPVITVRADKDCHIEGISWNDRLELYGSKLTNTEEVERENYIEGRDFESGSKAEAFRIEGYSKSGKLTETLCLLTTRDYTCNYRTNDLHNIIVITNKLFLLQMLQKGRIDIVQQASPEDIATILDLFDVEFVKSLSIEELLDLERYGLVGQTYDKTVEKINQSENILRNKRN